MSISLTHSLLRQPIVQTYEDSPHKKTTCACYIVPPYISNNVQQMRLENADDTVRALAAKHFNADDSLRNMRKFFHHQKGFTFQWPWDIHHTDHEADSTPTQTTLHLTRQVYDTHHHQRLPGKLIISNINGVEKGKTSDASVEQALTNALNVFKFYLDVYQHNSIDGKGMPITSTVHFGKHYENAFWNGQEMVYGDGSDIFDAFVKYLDVVGHEMTHGVTGDRLNYENESGALNEHMSDVMGYLVYLYTNKLTTDDPKATWTVAEGIIKDGNHRYPLRSFVAPGTAYNTKLMGKDPQPAKYGDLYKGLDDEGGVHINSGIPNHAFYLVAKELGRYAWEKAGLIWFTTLIQGSFNPNASMKEFALATIQTADKLFPKDTKIEGTLRNAWKTVEVLL